MAQTTSRLNVVPEINPALILIFRASLHQGTTPDDWRKANVNPIFETGDRNSPANYRPISLTLICSKVMEHTIHRLCNTLTQIRSFDKVSHQLQAIKLQYYGVKHSHLRCPTRKCSRTPLVLTIHSLHATEGRFLLPTLSRRYPLVQEDTDVTVRSCKMPSANCNSGRKTGRCH